MVVLGYLAVTFAQVVVTAGAEDRTRTDAAVVLGAAQWNGRPSPVLRARLDEAHRLYDAGVVRRVVLTGSKQPGDRFTEAYAGYRYLAEQGVPRSALVIVDDGTSTYESLAAASRVLAADGDRTVTLVSDGYHLRRLQGIAGELGLDARVAASGVSASSGDLVRETGLVAVGEVLGYGRMLRHAPT
ncbi:MAG: YdcF family protein [Microthrixaceae bacterium]